jgi:hypothetical protein
MGKFLFCELEGQAPQDPELQQNIFVGWAKVWLANPAACRQPPLCAIQNMCQSNPYRDKIKKVYLHAGRWWAGFEWPKPRAGRTKEGIKQGQPR